MKYDVVTVQDNRKELGSRRDFELQRSEKDAWKPVSWARLKKAAKEESGTRRPHVEVVVRPAMADQWIGEPQEFGLDANGALKAAKLLIHDGLADSVWVDVRYHRAFDPQDPRTFTLYYLERARQENPAVAGIVAAAVSGAAAGYALSRSRDKRNNPQTPSKAVRTLKNRLLR